jgi:hypothetical protein
MFEPPVRQGWLRWRRQATEGLRQPRVVLECPDGADPARVARSLADAGYDVSVCNGPSPRHRCTLAETSRCGLIEDADAVVNLLGTDTPERVEVESVVRTRYPAVPVVVGRHVRGHGPNETEGDRPAHDVQDVIDLVDRALQP